MSVLLCLSRDGCKRIPRIIVGVHGTAGRRTFIVFEIQGDSCTSNGLFARLTEQLSISIHNTAESNTRTIDPVWFLTKRQRRRGCQSLTLCHLHRCFPAERQFKFQQAHTPASISQNLLSQFRIPTSSTSFTFIQLSVIRKFPQRKTRAFQQITDVSETCSNAVGRIFLTLLLHMLFFQMHLRLPSSRTRSEQALDRF